MVDRIRTLLASRQLTPTQFADAIGVARPIVSHILSGRNKPSLEVVQRILSALPDLSMPWLLNGTGPMLAGPAAAPTSAPQAAPPPLISPPVAPPSPAPAALAVARTESALPVPEKPAAPAPIAARLQTAVRAPTAQAGPAPNGTPRRFTNKPAASAPLGQREPAEAVVADPPVGPAAAPADRVGAGVPPHRAFNEEPGAAASPAATAGAPSTALSASVEKPIRRIVIFYRDGSFSDYQPE